MTILGTRRRAALATVVLVAIAPACGDDDKKPAARTADTSTTTSSSQQETAGVTLEAPGAEPRQHLALRLRSGDVARNATVATVTVRITTGGSEVPIGSIPPVKTVTEQRIDRVDRDGTGHYVLTVLDASVVPTPGAQSELVRAMETAIKDMKGIRGTGTVSPRGANHPEKLDTSRVTNPIVKQQLDGLSSQVSDLAVPFPAAPVGRGARWTATRDTTINGIHTTTKTTYTLRERNGDRYTLDFTQTASAPPGPADIPGMPAGAQMAIESFDVRSTGTVGGVLTRSMPDTATIKGAGDPKFVVTVGNERQSVTERLTIETVLTPA